MNIQAIIFIYLILGVIVSYFLVRSEGSQEGVKEAVEEDWGCSDEDFKGYLDWVRELIEEKEGK